MTKFKAWPFLVSSNRTTDYKVIVAPDFMIESNQSDLLIHLATGQPTERAIYREYTSNLGDISLFYRVVYANDSGNILKDEFGRQIRWIEGFVLRDNVKNYDMTEQILDIAHSHVEGAFQDFWNNDTKFVTRSKAIDIYLNQSENLLRTQYREQPTTIQSGWSTTPSPPEPPFPWEKIALVCFLIGILFVGIWFVFVFPHMEIVSPQGSEDLHIGGTYNIKWKATGIDNALIDIKYSYDGTKTWSNIAIGVPNDGNFKWTVPNMPCSECYVLIEARDSKGASLVSRQSNKFTIS